MLAIPAISRMPSLETWLDAALSNLDSRDYWLALSRETNSFAKYIEYTRNAMMCDAQWQTCLHHAMEYL